MAGAAGRVALASGAALRSKGQQTIPAGDRLVLDMPGGGGFGEPHQRDPARVAADVADGLVSREAAREVYGVVVTKAGEVDEAGTEGLRGGR